MEDKKGCKFHLGKSFLCLPAAELENHLFPCSSLLLLGWVYIPSTTQCLRRGRNKSGRSMNWLFSQRWVVQADTLSITSMGSSKVWNKRLSEGRQLLWKTRAEKGDGYLSWRRNTLLRLSLMRSSSSVSCSWRTRGISSSTRCCMALHVRFSSCSQQGKVTTKVKLRLSTRGFGSVTGTDRPQSLLEPISKRREGTDTDMRFKLNTSFTVTGLLSLHNCMPLV